MDDLNKIIDNTEVVQKNFEYEEKMRKLREEVAKKFEDYRNTLNYMACDAPISILCLPSVIEKALIAHGLLRIYDLFNCDFTEVKGLGVSRTRDLTTCLDKFFAML